MAESSTTLLCASEHGEVVFCDASFRAKDNSRSIERARESADLATFAIEGWYAAAQVLVEQPLPPTFEHRVKAKHSGALRLPSGRLRAIDQQRLADHEQTPRNEVALTPGNYRVEAFELEWGDEPKRAVVEASARASPRGHRLARTLNWLSGASLVALLAIPLLAKTVLVWPLVAASAASVLATATVRSLRSVDTALNAGFEASDAFPAVVLQLTLMKDATSSLRGVKLGRG